MRSYFRFKPLFPIKISTYCIIILETIIVLMLGLLCNGDYYWWITLDVIFAFAFFIMWLPNFIVSQAKYTFLDKHLLFSCLGIIKYKRKYSKFDFMIISNAAYGHYTRKPSDYAIRRAPWTEKNELGISVVLPYCSMHRKGYDTRNLCKNKSSYDLSWTSEKRDSLFIGICRENVLFEVLTHTAMPVYILEDVYLRFEERFDKEIEQSKALNRIFIVSDRNISYSGYVKSKTDL